MSVGYDAEYVPTGPGGARQRNIVANHVALVDEARCGPTCSIGDSAPQQNGPMPQYANCTMGGAAHPLTQRMIGLTEGLSDADRRKFVQRDAQRSCAALRAINRANADYWSKASRHA